MPDFVPIYLPYVENGKLSSLPKIIRKDRGKPVSDMVGFFQEQIQNGVIEVMSGDFKKKPSIRDPSILLRGEAIQGVLPSWSVLSCYVQSGPSQYALYAKSFIGDFYIEDGSTTVYDCCILEKVVEEYDLRLLRDKSLFEGNHWLGKKVLLPQAIVCARIGVFYENKTTISSWQVGAVNELLLVEGIVDSLINQVCEFVYKYNKESF